jgi:L-alanine-DL-glutamate epimerase-like enolase superfamily enzyme
MKINDLRIVIHERKMPAGTGRPSTPLGVMTISTDEGIDGTVFLSAPGPDVTQQLVSVVKPRLLGRDPLDIGAIWHAIAGMARMLDPTVQGYVDLALWDITGKVAGLPVHRLLGTCRTSAPAYASSWVHPDNATYAEEAAAYAAQGFAGYKLHPPTQRRRMPIGDGGPVAAAEDVAVCAEVRAEVGDGYCLMLDSAWAYSYREALDVGFAIQDLGFHWYEDPLGAEDIDGYVRLKQHLWIPIVATETTIGGLYALPRWVAARATDALRGDVIIKGGITGMMKIAALAEAHQLPCEVHDAYNAIGNLATVHVVMAAPGCSMYEVLCIHESGSYDLRHLSYGLAEPIVIDSDGFVHAPQGPGLGIGIDWDLIRSGTVAELSLQIFRRRVGEGTRSTEGDMARGSRARHSDTAFLGLLPEHRHDLRGEQAHGPVGVFGSDAGLADLDAQMGDETVLSADDSQEVLGDLVDRAGRRDSETDRLARFSRPTHVLRGQRCGPAELAAAELSPHRVLVADPKEWFRHGLERVVPGASDAHVVDEPDEVLLRPPAVLAHHPFICAGNIRGDEMVATLGGLPHALRTESAPEDRYTFLHRAHDPADSRKVVVLAFDVELFFAAVQALLDDVDDLPSAPEPLAGVNPEGVELLPLRADADAEIEASVGCDVHGCDVLR